MQSTMIRQNKETKINQFYLKLKWNARDFMHDSIINKKGYV